MAELEHSRPFLTAEWRNLVMVTFVVDPTTLIERVPGGTTLDSWHGKTFASIVGFQFRDTKVLGAPVPFHQDFEEVNLRFYVRRAIDGESRAGVVFICETVPRPMVGSMARLLYREPYMVVPMRSKVRADPVPEAEYEWQAHGRWNAIAARAEGRANPAAPGSVEHFLTWRHWGYNGEKGKDTLEYRIEHPPWRLWEARDVRIDVDFEALCGKELAAQLKGRAPAYALIAEGSNVAIHWRTRLAA